MLFSALLLSQSDGVARDMIARLEDFNVVSFVRQSRR